MWQKDKCESDRTAENVVFRDVILNFKEKWFLSVLILLNLSLVQSLFCQDDLYGSPKVFNPLQRKLYLYCK
jgi:hypothetical protein